MNADIGSPPVLDGRTGRVVEVDGEPAAFVEIEPPVLIVPDLHDLLTSLTRQDEQIARLERDRERTRDALKEAKSVREQLIEQIKSRNEGSVELPFGRSADDLDEDVPEDEAEDAMPL